MTARRVVLLHGLSRSARSLMVMKAALGRRGMTVRALDYASTRGTIAEHAEALKPAIRDFAAGARISFVTHSMGGIVLRALLHSETGDMNLRAATERAVMLAPPNAGSAIIDRIGTVVPIRWLNGPAGEELERFEGHTGYPAGQGRFTARQVAKSVAPLRSSRLTTSVGRP